MSLAVTLRNGLSLADPFVIASSHWTANQNAIRALAAVAPAAVTLKTTSLKHGGRHDEALGKRNQRKMEDGETEIARFTDGPKYLEFWDITTTVQAVDTSATYLPQSKIGLSILQGENYRTIRKYLDSFCSASYHYVELNLKYSLRSQVMGLDAPGEFYDTLKSYLDALTRDVIAFLEVFSDTPTTIKLPRESLPYLQFPEMQELLKQIHGRASTVIIANSLRTTVPRSYEAKAEKLERGVVTGNHLFLSTYDAVLHIDADLSGGGFVMASGGIASLANCLDLAEAGADAFQLCSVLDSKGINYLTTLREQLSDISKPHGGFEGLRNVLRSDPNFGKELVARAKENENWSRTAATNLFHDTRANLLPLFEEAVKVELSECASMAVEQPTGEELAGIAGMTFLLSRGNLSAYAVQRECCSLSGGTILDVGTSGRLLTLLRDKTFSYDVCMLPRSLFDALRKQDADVLGDRIPVELCTCGVSMSEVVGYSGVALSDIKTLFHFDGPTAREALIRLVSEESLGKVQDVSINREHLEALLSFWRKDSAILAKPPLSRIYGQLSNVRGSWAPLWGSTESIVVALSLKTQKALSDEKLDVLRRLYGSVARAAHADSARTAGICFDSSTLQYFAELLGVKKTQVVFLNS